LLLADPPGLDEVVAAKAFVAYFGLEKVESWLSQKNACAL
jgi:hypothetical protein